MRRLPTGSLIGWARLNGRLATVVRSLAESQPGDKRVIRLDLTIDVQGAPLHGSVRAEGRVRALGSVPSAAGSTSLDLPRRGV